MFDGLEEFVDGRRKFIMSLGVGNEGRFFEASFILN
jgi:hypothetical protein